MYLLFKNEKERSDRYWLFFRMLHVQDLDHLIATIYADSGGI